MKKIILLLALPLALAACSAGEYGADQDVAVCEIPPEGAEHADGHDGSGTCAAPDYSLEYNALAEPGAPEDMTDDQIDSELLEGF